VVSEIEEFPKELQLKYPPRPGVGTGVAFSPYSMSECFFACARRANVRFRAADDVDLFRVPGFEFPEDALPDVGLRFGVRAEDLRRVFDAAIEKVSVQNEEEAGLVLGDEGINRGEVLLVTLP